MPPGEELVQCASKLDKILDIEMNMGQMLEDIERFLPKDKKIQFYGRSGGIVPSMDEVRNSILEMIRS